MKASKITSENAKLLIFRDPPEGFFSNYFFVLEGIWKARELGLDPLIGFPVNLRSSRGSDESKVERWSDYFDVDEDFGNNLASRNISRTHRNHLGLLRELSPEELGKLAKELLPLKRSIRQEFDAVCGRILSPKPGTTLGVHYRGGDMYWHPSHPTPPSMSQMIHAVRMALNHSRFSSVFVATDSPAFVRKLQKSIEVPVFTMAHPRSINLGWRSRGLVKSVLLDSYLLSRCDGLVHSGSNVSFGARVFRGAPYQCRIHVTLGVNPSSLRIAITKAIWRICIPERLRKEKPRFVFED